MRFKPLQGPIEESDIENFKLARSGDLLIYASRKKVDQC